MKDNREKVIFRREYEPYMKQWQYLACFPDDPAEYPGAYINGIPFYFTSENHWIREPYTGMSYGYYMKTKIIHKNDPIIPMLLKALESMGIQDDNAGFKVVEKKMR